MGSHFMIVLLLTVLSQVLSHTELTFRECGLEPLAPAFGYVEKGASYIGATRDIGCIAGYKLDGQSFVTCQSSGEWSNTARCISRNSNNSDVCSQEPQHPFYGYVEEGSSYSGAMRRIICVAGYEVVGQPFVMCLSNGEWSIPGSCSFNNQGIDNTRECHKEPKAPDNGFVDVGVSQTGAVRRIGCFPDYKLVGQRYVSCISNGDWSIPGTCVFRKTGNFTQQHQDPVVASGDSEHRQHSMIIWFVNAVLTSLVIVFNAPAN